MRTAILEDDTNQAQVLARWLADAGHDCHAFESGKALVRNLGRETYDLLLLDWNVPDMSGPEVLAWVRNSLRSTVPVIFVTAQHSENAIVEALSCGADDYLVKPVRRRELVARALAVYRRAHSELASESGFELAPYRFDVKARRVELHGRAVELTDKEFDLALFIFRERGRVLSRGHILERIWGRNADVVTRTIDTHMSRLRSKLDLGAHNGVRLSSVYSYGYRLEKVDA
ncbi:MAG: response regulator transcription factor [Burkholderiales bacterium]|nr:response regulator transcription factor [Burkholderiales bacterium]